ncbi:MAG: sugar transferase [Chloroflexota bacterium]|nr:sugar transferase [Chloroflexota bacterium]
MAQVELVPHSPLLPAAPADVLVLPDGTEARPRAASRLRHAGVAMVGALAAGILGMGSIVLAYFLRIGWPVCGSGLCVEAKPYVPVLVFAGLLRPALFLLGNHTKNRRYGGVIDEMVDGAREAGLGSLAIVLFTFFYRQGLAYRAFSYSRAVFIFDGIFTTFLLTALIIWTKSALIGLRQKGFGIRNVAVVGSSRTADAFVGEMTAHPEAGYRVVAHFKEGEGPQELVERLVELASTVRLDEIVLALSNLGRSDLTGLVEAADLRHIDIKAVPELFGLSPRKVAVTPTGEFPVLALLQEPLPGIRRFIKRTMDVVIATVALATASPLMLLAAVAVKVSSRGPILFRQRRMGMDGRPFDMLKFRTMYQGASAAQHQEYVLKLINGEAEARDDGETKLYKLVDDPRVTPVGRVLRRFSVDELPQLWNVLRGDMSLVGPRPPLDFEVAAYKEWQRQRLDMRPGVTGLWQVSGRSRMTFEEMVLLDIEYVQNWSPTRDLAIIARTIPALLRKDAA